MIEKVVDGYSIPIAILAVTLGTLTYFSRGSRRTTFLPGVQSMTMFLFVYYSHFRMIYGKGLKTVPPLCLLHQAICGYCKLYDTQKIFRVWILNRSYVLFYKPETVEVLVKSPVTIEKPREYSFLQPWLGTGLLTSKRDKWRIRRKLLTPTFHFRILEDFLPIFDDQSRVLVSQLSSLAQKPWIDVMPLITMCTLDIICQTAMGVKINAQSGGCSEYVAALCEIGETTMHRILKPWFWFDALFFRSVVGRKFKSNLQMLHDFTRKVIREKKEKMLENYANHNEIKEDIDGLYTRKKGKAFLELLLEHHMVDKSFTEDDIREEVDTFMFGGHDTTAMALCWALHSLGLYPGIQDEVYKELGTIFEDDFTRPITRDDLTNMKYLECVIKETLRHYPSAPLFARELQEDISVLDYTVPSGSVCIIYTLALHKDPVSFPNPEKFDPERFSPENCSGRHPYSYVPFSAGPRNCIGQKFALMEMKAVLANIFRNFRVESLDHRDKVNVMPEMILRNVDPLRIRFISRR